MNKVFLGDSLEVLKELPDNSVDSIVTDAPYGLSKEPNIAEVLTHWLAGDDYTHKSKGFMGKSWDSFVPSPKVWKECYRVLKPGGHILCFAGTRTQDLMGISLRLGGFEVRDCVYWHYGTGKPSSTNNLKPASEPIILARKKLEQTLVENLDEWGTGKINIETCRVGKTKNVPASVSRSKSNVYQGGVDGSLRKETGNESGHNPNIGRWPANLIHDGSDEVANLFPLVQGESGKQSAARFFYSAKTSKKERTCNGQIENKHPTVKPIALMSYLCRLITPPGGTVLDPFAGSGTTAIAAMREGFNYILIELEEPSYNTCLERIALEQ